MTSTLEPSELSVQCGGQQHRLHWASGTLTALDHEDADGERTLAALGGEPATCIQILDTWSRYDADLAVLVNASRGPHDPLVRQHFGGSGRFVAMNQTGILSRPRPAAVGWTVYAPMPGLSGQGPQFDDVGTDLPSLLTLGGGLPERLAATVIGNWAARIDRGEDVSDALPSLRTALYGRAVPVVRRWLGDPARPVNLELAAAGAEARIERDEDSLRLAFPFSWLRDVWVPGLHTMLDEFCVAASRTDDGTWELTTLDRDLTTRHTITVHRS